MLSSVNDVHHRDGEPVISQGPQVLVSRFSTGRCCCSSNSHRDSENRVCAELLLVRRPIELDHQSVNVALRRSILADDAWSDDFDHVGDRFQNSLAMESLHVPITQLQGFVDSRRCSRGNGSSSLASILSPNIHFYCGVSSRIQNLSCSHVHDLGTTRNFLRH